jgi:hypothetical protein
VVQERCDFPSFATCRNYVNAQPKSSCTQNQWSAGNWGVNDDATEERFNSRYR